MIKSKLLKIFFITFIFEILIASILIIFKILNNLQFYIFFSKIITVFFKKKKNLREQNIK